VAEPRNEEKAAEPGDEVSSGDATRAQEQETNQEAFMQTSEEDIVARLRTGDSAALAQFIELRRPQLMAYIERQLGAALRRKVEPDDIFQETSAEAVRSLPGAGITERDPFGWLCQIAERKIIDLHRRYFDAQKRDAGREVPLSAPSGGSEDQQAGLINMLVASMTTPSQAFSRNAREARLLDALQALPEDQREALRLRYIENMPSKQIAERLGKSDAAVRVMLTRSLKKLQDLLGEEDAPTRL
jgi:RNA polymerase sigma-70 factor, ECF subfamily